jgi:hypothetical protein
MRIRVAHCHCGAVASAIVYRDDDDTNLTVSEVEDRGVRVERAAAESIEVEARRCS